MSNETKRDVFDELLKMYRNSMALTHEEPVILDNDGYDVFGKIEKSYAEALPDDLPVIPEAVGEYIKERKAVHDSLAFALTARFIPNEVFEWMLTVTGDPDTELSQIEYVKQQDIFARAWVLGVWRVEETGEIVKLEAEK